MKKQQAKRSGFYMNVTEEDRLIINELQKKYSVNISQLFKNFIKTKLDEFKKHE